MSGRASKMWLKSYTPYPSAGSATIYLNISKDDIDNISFKLWGFDADLGKYGEMPSFLQST